MTILAFFLSPIGRYLAIGIAALAIVGGAYTKGRIDGRAGYKAQIQGEINATIKDGTDARQRAADELNAGRVPERWFRD